MYIRTDDGIEKIDDDWNEFYKDHVNNRQADTIAELCDLFYLDRGGDLDINDFYDKYQFDVAEEYYLEEIRHFIPIKLKAYIETDKGLIYVAKMNDKGDLELI